MAHFKHSKGTKSPNQGRTSLVYSNEHLHILSCDVTRLIAQAQVSPCKLICVCPICSNFRWVTIISKKHYDTPLSN